MFGRSITYRAGALQVLSMAAWHEVLPSDVSEAQVRGGLTAVLRNMFSVDGNFNEKGFLQLGLAADHPFWTSEPQDWTSKKAWTGQPFTRDGASRD